MEESQTDGVLSGGTVACAVAETSPPLAGRCRTCKAVKVIFLETNRSREKESGRCNIRTREELAMKRFWVAV